jgi:hypothetical protein
LSYILALQLAEKVQPRLNEGEPLHLGTGRLGQLFLDSGHVLSIFLKNIVMGTIPLYRNDNNSDNIL